MITLLVASVLAGLPPSEAALKAYEMACDSGELRLGPSEAKVSSSKPSGYSYPLHEWGDPQSVTTIDLAYPARTSIQIATYDAKDPRQVAKACIMYTRSLTREDAVRALLSGVQQADITRDLNPARWNTPLEIDRPKEGYRKQLMFEENNVTIIQTDMYKAPH